MCDDTFDVNCAGVYTYVIGLSIGSYESVTINYINLVPYLIMNLIDVNKQA